MILRLLGILGRDNWFFLSSSEIGDYGFVVVLVNVVFGYFLILVVFGVGRGIW